MDLQQLREVMSKAEVETTDVVGPQRRAFLNAAFLEHLGAEMAGDVPAIVATFAKDGHLSFNGVRYDTPERLTAFHKDFRLGRPRHAIGHRGRDRPPALHTRQRGRGVPRARARAVALGEAPAGRAVAFPMCVIYRFDEGGKLLSERAYADSGSLLPQPDLPL